ncbi:sigma-70 family RNA polymerase sigma factor [Streptomyces sp. NPDC051976]|uniref:sigma-70 family RNA polymerase sigma factor n=1 Tax=Streptomyces sp. NPDC051976 TaxID=3154947 RepID=UPI0034409EA6
MTDQEPLGIQQATPALAVADADADADFSSFYRSFIATLAGFLVWQGASAAIAAELAQETMIEALRAWPRIEHPAAWARRTASRKLVRHHSSIVEDPVDPVPETTALVSFWDGLADWENRQTLRDLFQHLPPRQRQMLAWTVAGYTPAQIAEELALDSSVVRANLMKARRAAARFLTAQEEA